MNKVDPTFRFKQFAVSDRRCGMKIGTDGVLLGAWARMYRIDGDVVDVGAGCGLISLMLAQRYAYAQRICALEIDAGAYADLWANVAASPWSDRIECVEGDFRKFTGMADLIVSNPPFFATGHHSPDFSRALARHGGLGLSPITLIGFAKEHLAPEGRLAMIFPSEMLSDVEMEAALQRMELSRVCRVTTCHGKAPSRILAELSSTATTIEYSELAIYDVDRRFTAEYVALTNEFYLNFV